MDLPPRVRWWSAVWREGIDAAAVRGALRAGGTPVGVVGNGLDVYYPRENRYLYEDVAAAGALL